MDPDSSRRAFVAQSLAGLQHGDEIVRQHVQVMEEFRGREAGVAAAEAFVRVARVEPPARL